MNKWDPVGPDFPIRAQFGMVTIPRNGPGSTSFTRPKSLLRLASGTFHAPLGTRPPTRKALVRFWADLFN